MAASRMDSCGLRRYSRDCCTYWSALLLYSASWREREGTEGRVGAESPPWPGSPCTQDWPSLPGHPRRPASSRLVPGFGGSRGLAAARGAAVPRCCQSPAGPGLRRHPRARGGRGARRRARGAARPREGSVCGLQAGSDGLQQWAGAQPPAPHTGPWGQGACPGWVWGFGAILTRHSPTAHVCSLSSSCLSFLFFRNLVARSRVSREACRAAETGRWHRCPGHRTCVPCTWARLRAFPGPWWEDAAAGERVRQRLRCPGRGVGQAPSRAPGAARAAGQRSPRAAAL